MPVSIVRPKSEPYFFPGNEIGCLMVHGFTACPRELKLMGTYLHRKMGYTVHGIRLPGHATDANDMTRMRWWDWMAAVEDGYALLKSQTKQIYLMGLSMGGVISLLFSTRQTVNGVVTMSTPYHIPQGYFPYIRPIIPLLSTIMPTLKKGRKNHWFNPQALEDRFSYSVNPLRAAYELDRMLNLLHSDHSKLTAPLLMIHSKDDDYIPISHLIYYRNALPQAKFIQIEGANHLIAQDGDREKVFGFAADFVEEQRTKV
jgi:carboxylesterase